MIGLVLWYNPEPGVGMIWCEDQGPLAFLGPDVVLPEGAAPLDCGDQLLFSVETRDSVRYVRDVYGVTAHSVGADPREIISGFHAARDDEPGFRVVA